MDEIKKIKQEIAVLTERVDDIEQTANEAASHVVSLRKEYRHGHQELQESHKELKDKQEKVVNENFEQTRILNRIEERYQMQVEVAQNNEGKTLALNKWLVGAIWALVTIVMIVVITASINALIP
ncbi:LMBR1 domain-containing protein [Staphylococcus pseudintermedius]|uniref:LMBR1 domain-containing protein n=1 Tax=Staphylococcus pseudintermedius TaxID=283734 RepID=UPI001378391B|nr:LMBR1 domain-containing protein [Staphylococcus pseudintermedius]